MSEAPAKQAETVNVVDPFGKVGSLPKAQATEAFDNGYQLASPDEIRQAKNEEKFGGVQGAIFSGTLGAARSATLGASDWALTHLPEGVGFSPEELKGFSETNPAANAIGELGGILRDPLALAGVINKAGKATTEGAKSLIKAAQIAEDSKAAKILSTGASALGSGVEGAIYGGVASSINEAALGDSNLNSEKVLANMGYGAMLGGAAGGAFKVLGFGITPAIRKATDAMAELRNDLVGSGYGEEALIHRVLPKRFADAIVDRQLNLDTNGQASVLEKVVSSLNTVTNSIHDEISNFESEVHPEAKSALFKTSAKMAGEAQQQIAKQLTNAIDYIKSSLPEMSVSGEKLTDSVVPRGRLAETLDSLRKEAQFGSFWGGSSEKIFNTLKKLKENIMDVVEKEPSAAQPLAGVTDVIDGIRKDPSIFGPAGAATAIHEENMANLGEFISQDKRSLTPFQKTFGKVVGGKWQFDVKKLNEVLANKNETAKGRDLEMLSDFFSHIKDMPENMLNARRAIPNSRWRSTTLKQIVDNSEKTTTQAFQDYMDGIKKRRPLYGWKDYAPVLIAKWHPAIAAAIEAYDFYQDPVHATHGLALVERILGQTSKRSLDLIDQIFNPSFASRAAIEGKINETNRFDVENEDKKHQKIREWSSNPEHFAESMEKSTKELSSYAPNLTQNLHITTGNAVSFLNSKMPQKGNDLLGEPYKPSRNEMSKFERYRQIVDDPLKSLEQIRRRTITPETIETLNVVYPKLYAQLKQSLLEKAYLEKESGKPIPFQIKQAISMFLGEPVDQALQPQSILANQMLLSTEPKQGQMAQMKMRAKGLDKMDRSGRAEADYGAMSDKV